MFRTSKAAKPKPTPPIHIQNFRKKKLLKALGQGVLSPFLGGTMDNNSTCKKDDT